MPEEQLTIDNKKADQRNEAPLTSEQYQSIEINILKLCKIESGKWKERDTQNKKTRSDCTLFRDIISSEVVEQDERGGWSTPQPELQVNAGSDSDYDAGDPLLLPRHREPADTHGGQDECFIALLKYYRTIT